MFQSPCSITRENTVRLNFWTCHGVLPLTCRPRWLGFRFILDLWVQALVACYGGLITKAYLQLCLFFPLYQIRHRRPNFIIRFTLAIPTHHGNRRCKQASNAQALNAKSLVYSNSDEYCTAVSCRAKLNANDTTPLLSRWSRNRSFRKNFAQNSVQRSRGEKASMSFKIQLPH